MLKAYRAHVAELEALGIAANDSIQSGLGA